jgi:hypothetical protein
MSNNRLGHILFQSNGSGSALGGGFDLQDSPKQREPPELSRGEWPLRLPAQALGDRRLRMTPASATIALKGTCRRRLVHDQ